MIFIKRFEAYGFKSFAEKTILNFEYSMTGIVGPNGSGKSNITDAIRWALGEQSSKSLRGDSMEDVVFSGSSSSKPLNYAEVTITFNNTHNIFSNLDYKEIEIKRKFFKDTKESEFYLNKNRVRLKDIQEIAMQSGISKSSLAIISQGTISRFAEVKPDERRKIFDDAAGTSIYKKRKDESVRKLVRIRENQKRLQDILNEIERKLPNLKKQAQKAQAYIEKWDELKDIEISIIVKDIEAFQNRLASLTNQNREITNNLNQLEKDYTFTTENYNSYYKKISEIDEQISQLNVKYTKVVDLISELKVTKTLLEAKQKDEQKDSEQYRINNIVKNIKELELNKVNDNSNLQNLNNDFQKINDEIFKINLRCDEVSNKINSLRREIIHDESRIEYLTKTLNQNLHLHPGVKGILDNKKSLPGIVGTVEQLMSIKEGFETAVQTLIGSAFQNIVANNIGAVKNAINFLKVNKLGRATFLPIDNLKISWIPDDLKFAISKAPGFVAFANEVVIFDKEYQLIGNFLLGTSIVADTYENALQISKLTNKKYNVATVDGERIYPNGIIVGGNLKVKNNDSIEKQIESLNASKNEKSEAEKNLMNELESLKDKVFVLLEKQNQVKSSLTILKNQLEGYDLTISKFKNEYKALTGFLYNDNSNKKTYVSLDNQIIELAQRIKNYDLDKITINNEINTLRNTKISYNEKQNQYKIELDEKRVLIDDFKEKKFSLNLDQELLIEKKSNHLERLAKDYNLTFETAKTMELKTIDNEEQTRIRIDELRNDLKQIGNVNLDAIKEYEQENNRFIDYQNQLEDINKSVNSINKAIKEMDQKMVEQFTTIVNEVNKALPDSFKKLFNGGSAEILYTDPNNILETGIDIRVEPPGKKITNLNLLSGGEKSLVALTVLFSILKVRPLPIVVLDEVEAPLDVANVERFAKYLKTFISKTQFLIVTHRMGTMENCDILFGTTMEQKGVTKIVQIKLIEVKKLIN